MKIKPQPINPFRFIPETDEQLWNFSMMLCLNNENKARELILSYSAYGHLFDYDLGRILMNTYCLKGKPTLTADGMAGVCRKSGLVRYIKIVAWNSQGCTIEMARTDEPEGVAHRYTYTIEMAAQQGLTRNRNWQNMPMQMLRARALTMGLRATYPEACSGMYSADEIADNTHGLSDDERYEISAQSVGEEISTRPPQRHSQPPQRHHVERIAPPQPPQQHQAVEIEEVSELVEELPTPRVEEDVLDFDHVTTETPQEIPLTSLDDLREAAEYNYIDWHEITDCAARLQISLKSLSAAQISAFFYTFCLSAYIRRENTKVGWYQDEDHATQILPQLVAEFAPLGDLAPADVMMMAGDREFWEIAKVNSRATGDDLGQAQRILKKLVEKRRSALAS